jgi:hypothetical protein
MGSQEDPAAMLRLHVVLFRVLAGLSGAFFLSTLPQAISPWHGPMLSNMSGVHDPDLRRWCEDEYPNHSARTCC